MIPTKEQALYLFDKYTLPSNKRIHVTLVAKTAMFFAKRLYEKQNITMNERLLEAAALLHDIDKSVPKKEGEHHPDTAVRLLREEGFPEVADVVRSHPLHAILDPMISPKSWEEKVLYLSDKMVKYEIITVDKRFDLWRAENLPQQARDELANSFPYVKSLEREILSLAQVTPEEVAEYVKGSIL